MRFLNLLCEAKSGTRIIVSRSSSSKLLLRLILLKFALRIHISPQQNVATPESSSRKWKPSYVYKAVEKCLIILLGTS